MELTPKAQAVELIKQSKTVLILTHADPDGDALGSSLALLLTLKKLDKQAEVAFFGKVDPTMAFLPAFDQAKATLTASNDVILTIDTRATGEDLKLGYKKNSERHQITIVITPSKGSLLPEDVVVERSRPKYDLVIILDCSAVERLGPVAEEMPDLLYETPTISIDHHSTNSYFAKVNWVDLTSTSTAEMLVALIESLGRDKPLIDEEIATALLTGLITDTNSFQNMNTTPKALTVAAQLVASGARQQEIIDKVYKTKTLTTLKLWGKILSNVIENKELGFLWATIAQSEAESVGADASQTNGVVDGLLKSVADVDFVFLLSERDGKVHGSLRSVDRSVDVAEIARLFGGGGHVPAAAFEVDGTLETQKEAIIQRITEFQAERRRKIAGQQL